MVAQDLPVVAPKLSTNNYRAKTVRNCEPAAENEPVAFPTSNALKPFSGQTFEKYSNDYRYLKEVHTVQKSRNITGQDRSPIL